MYQNPCGLRAWVRGESLGTKLCRGLEQKWELRDVLGNPGYFGSLLRIFTKLQLATQAQNGLESIFKIDIATLSDFIRQ